MSTDARTGPAPLAPNAGEVAACCSDLYSRPAARWLLGESLHPGGLALTRRVAELANVGAGTRLLDVGSGRGASAVSLAESLGCEVVGLTLEETGVEAGRALAEERGVAERVRFVQDDVQSAVLGDGKYDAALMECVLSILPDKRSSLARISAALRQGGRLAVTDVSVNGPIPPEYLGVLSVAGCVGDARPLDEYVALVRETGLRVLQAEDLPATASDTVLDVKGKLMLAELGSRLGKLPIDASLISRGKELIAGVQRLIDEGTLSYCMLIAEKP